MASSKAHRGDDLYRTMFEANPLPMWMFDRETLRFVAVNEAAIRHYGFSRDEFLAMTLADIRPPEDVGAMRADVRRAHGLVEAAVWRHRKKNGALIDVEVRANDLTIDGREVRIALLTDVTDRERARDQLRRTEDQLRHAQKMDAIGRLAGGVAHDFNNLLTVIQSYACLLEETGAESARRDAGEIRRAAERATGITRQLLTLSRHGIANPRLIDLDDVIANLVPMLQRLLGEDVAILAPRSELPRVLADPGQIEQVVMNLAINARDAMPNGGRLTIESECLELDDDAAAIRGLPRGRYVTVAITDTGTGMDADTQRRVFEPFFTTKEAGKGTGLGLAIVHGIVVQAGGAVSVYSEPGHGTTFRVHLPASDTAVEPAPRPSRATPRSLPRLTVLVVDDHGEVRAATVRILAEAGCHVLEAATADEARRACVSHDGSIDVIVLDVVLSDGRGDLVLPQLRELRPAAGIVLMSGYPAGTLGASGAAPPDLLAKPFTPAELRAAVAKAIEPTAAGRRAGPTSPDLSGRWRVLVVDDDEQLRRTLGRLLRREGTEPIEVVNGREALAELATSRFDVIISDIHMPHGGGLELLRAVRRVDLDIPVILISGATNVETAREAIEYGAFRYLDKPLDTEQIGKIVHQAARAHALARLRREALTVAGAHAGASDRAGLEVRFDQALEGLWMAFQPIVEARTGAMYGVEALMRSSEPSMPTPPAVLDAASQLGRLAHLGRRVRSLAATAIAGNAGTTVFVNLHPEDLVDSDLVDEAAPLTRIARRVILEVTERAQLDASPEVQARIARLRSYGFRLALDDIGAGYSGLTTFTELTPEIVKIDMSLIRGVHASALKQRTIKALCRLCREVGCLVVAEGIETPAERDCLIDLGCDLLQGFLLGRPSRELP